MITTSISRSDLRHRSLSPPAALLAALPLLLLGAAGCQVEVDDDWDNGRAHVTWNDHRHDNGRCPTPGRCPLDPGRHDRPPSPPPPPVDAGRRDAGPPPAERPPTPPPTTSLDAGVPPVTTPPTTPAPTDSCRVDAQCGGGRCLAGACQPRCTSDAACGTGHSCREGFCQPPLQPGNACLYSSACADGGVCINGSCHQRCAGAGGDTPTMCSNAADHCDRGVCRPDGRPRPQCTGNAQCPTGWSCVDAICRTACQDDSQCGPNCSGTVCARGFCVMPEEVAPPMCPSGPCAGNCSGVCR